MGQKDAYAILSLELAQAPPTKKMKSPLQTLSNHAIRLYLNDGKKYDV